MELICNSLSMVSRMRQRAILVHGLAIDLMVVSNEMISSERYSLWGASPQGGGLAENG